MRVNRIESTELARLCMHLRAAVAGERGVSAEALALLSA
jgi:hypothetical protein